ncbi:hypothetical protein Saur03_01509 [Staphylococcus aureus]
MRKDAKENRQRIEEIAHKLFDEEGVENISMNRIAKELGIVWGHCIDISKIKAIYATTSYKETLIFLSLILSKLKMTIILIMRLCKCR